MREFPDNQSPDIGPLARPDEPTPVPDLRRLGRRSRDYGRARDPCRRRRGDYLSQRDDHPMAGRRRPVEASRSGRKDCCGGIGFRRVRSGAGRDRIVDLQGRTLFPGFIDPHHHTVLSALFADLLLNIGYPKYSNRAEALAALKAVVAKAPPRAMDPRRLLRQPVAGWRPVDEGAECHLDPASDFHLLRERTRRRRERKGVQTRQNRPKCRRTSRRRPFRPRARRQVERA